jgi:MinD-like ATPase involved in chromosome partitioning or flagellar assembly
MTAGDIAKVLRESYEIHLLLDGLYELSEVLKLDYLLLDTHPGLNEETLLTISKGVREVVDQILYLNETQT